MDASYRGTVAALALAVGLGLLVQLASFILKLGFFWPAPWVVGGVLVGWSVRGVLSGGGRIVAVAAGVAAMLAYVATLHLTESRWFGQKNLLTVPMTWENRGADSDLAEPEVVLRYVDFPRSYIGLQSRELARQLAAGGRDTLQVSLRVTRDLGCLRGLSVQEIEGTSGWQAAWQYNGSTGAGRIESPVGPDPAWCP